MRKFTLVSTILVSMLTLNPSTFAVAQNQSDENTNASRNQNFQQKNDAKKTNHGGMRQHKDKIIPISGNMNNHDDVVGSRANGGSNVVIRNPNTKPKHANTSINCKHPAYKTLCAELLKAAKPEPPPPPPPPKPPQVTKNVWHHLASRSSYSTAKLEMGLPISLSHQRPRYIRINGATHSFNGNTKRIRVASTAGTHRNGKCSATSTEVSACYITATSSGVTGCTGNRVRRKIAVPYSGGANSSEGGACGSGAVYWNLKYAIRKIELKY